MSLQHPTRDLGARLQVAEDRIVSLTESLRLAQGFAEGIRADERVIRTGLDRLSGMKWSYLFHSLFWFCVGLFIGWMWLSRWTTSWRSLRPCGLRSAEVFASMHPITGSTNHEP